MTQATALSPKVRVLVVDDSAFARSVLTRYLTSDPEITVVGYAGDGIEALEKVKALKPYVVTMDISMPRMDGLGALKELMRECPTPTVMVSALTREGAQVTMEALHLGAVDFVLKPMRAGVSLPQEIEDGFCAKVKAAASARVTTAKNGQRVAVGPEPPRRPSSLIWQDRIVVVGSSTGGPQALCTVLPALPADMNVPVLAVQHMPAGFTASLAERLNSLCRLRVQEARQGSRLEPGLILLAPGGYHMTVSHNGEIRLNSQPPECGVRPSVNVTMESVARVYGRETLGVILTGMGSDGTRGAGLIKTAGGQVIAEAAESCVVYGMPRSVFEAGYTDAVMPLPSISREIVKRCTLRKSRDEAGHDRD